MFVKVDFYELILVRFTFFSFSVYCFIPLLWLIKISTFIVFCSPKLKYDLTLANIKVNNISHEQVKPAKFLSVYIDSIYLGINIFKLLLPKFLRLMVFLISFKNTYLHL